MTDKFKAEMKALREAQIEDEIKQQEEELAGIQEIDALFPVDTDPIAELYNRG
jgi:hypothetical protein